jgi:ankyrin repeat protein
MINETKHHRRLHINALGVGAATALMLATHRGAATIVQRLLEFGADVNTCNIDGCNALHSTMKTKGDRISVACGQSGHK